MDKMFKWQGDQAWRSGTPHYESDLEMCTKLSPNLSDLHLQNRVPQSRVKVESITGKKRDDNQASASLSDLDLKAKSDKNPAEKEDKQAGNTNLENLTSEPQNNSEKSWKKAKRYYLGLKNIGNTCYLNASLQALFLTSALRAYVIRSSSAPANGVHLVLSRLFIQMDRGSSKRNHYVEPEEFASYFMEKKPQFVRGEQHDAQEFISILIDMIHEEVNKADKTVAIDARPVARNAEEAWSYHFKYIDKSPLAKIFLSQIQSCLECQKCHHQSRSWNCCWQIPLNLGDESDGDQSERDLSIEDCLQDFASREMLDDPHCEHCKTNGPASKQQIICRASRYFILVLKRFDHTGRKITRTVDVNRHLEVKGEDYHLYACVLHKGSESLGHYMTLFNQHCSDRDWLLLDDEEIKDELPPDKVDVYLKELSYICFYKQVRKHKHMASIAMAPEQHRKLLKDMHTTTEPLPDIYNH